MQPTFEAFFHRVQTTPNRIALSVEGESISFAELLPRIIDIAERLHATRKEQQLTELMPILVDRTLTGAVSIVAAYFAGIPFTLIDEGTPLDYAKSLLDKLEVRHPIWIPDSKVDSTQNNRLELSPHRIPIPEVSADSFAFAILTSGSAGTPKAVMHSRKSGVAVRSYRFPNSHTVDYAMLTVTPFAFAVGLVNLLLVSLGVSSYNIKPSNYSPKIFFEKFRQLQPTHAYMPSQFARLYGHIEVEPVIEGVHQVQVGGEALRVEHVQDLARAFSPSTEFKHLLGSSEAICNFAWHRKISDMSSSGQIELTAHPEDGMLIERKEYGDDIYELYSGNGLALGYYNNPDLTAERFLEINGKPWWKSGDLLKQVGVNEYLHYGRIDDMVKISGYLVSPSTISNALMSLAEVSMAVVISRQESDRHTLHAYVEVRDGTETNSNDLKTALLDLIPAYMIPQEVEIVDQIPINTRGKTDRQAIGTNPSSP